MRVELKIPLNTSILRIMRTINTSIYIFFLNFQKTNSKFFPIRLLAALTAFQISVRHNLFNFFVVAFCMLLLVGTWQ